LKGAIQTVAQVQAANPALVEDHVLRHCLPQFKGLAAFNAGLGENSILALAKTLSLG